MNTPQGNPRLMRVIFINLLVLSFIGATPLRATEKLDPIILIKINGLSCPFCAYGVEKKLSALAGVKTIKIKMNQGEVIVTFTHQAKINLEAIKQAVQDAGFTARTLTRVNSPSPHHDPR